ncbi:hypothetical protein F3K40_42870 [Streptomyces sp. LBUM 1478]|uniref:hypothetical protein n=1 Tax=Streptomyces TaxID=1883 RepID=UPI000765F9BE|nr:MULTISPECIES: hypothetical protein [Streptomyces]MBP5910642.1 hypothetical protein [Streptomyces sp. LBUM 1478]MBP5911742.1 hypothetical protein [Streptomyces sp. LBUM 1486]MDX2540002.1 hypothetical protein [Streptomyces scabiei]MDX2802273.1 hypothetical protein [Streptomyces scabiei]MDX2860682.1 hypothetical protein [Streptomyces scabiei]
MTFPFLARRVALAAVIVLCATVTTACGGDGGTADRRQPSGNPTTASVTGAPDPAITDLTEVGRILDDAESAAAAVESDAVSDG